MFDCINYFSFETLVIQCWSFLFSFNTMSFSFSICFDLLWRLVRFLFSILKYDSHTLIVVDCDNDLIMFFLSPNTELLPLHHLLWRFLFILKGRPDLGGFVSLFCIHILRQTCLKLRYSYLVCVRHHIYPLSEKTTCI